MHETRIALEQISAILGDLDADLSDRVNRAYAVAEAAIRRDMEAEAPPETGGVCANCRSWDDEPGECNDPNSAIYRMTVAAEREPWADAWGCSLFAPKVAG